MELLRPEEVERGYIAFLETWIKPPSILEFPWGKVVYT
jgi:hypothetical protein